MDTVTGRVATDRPERYAKQLISHWAARGPSTDQGGTTVQRWETGQVIILRPTEGVLEIEVGVPDGDDVDQFAQVVTDHLERIGKGDDLDVEWDS